MPLHSPLYTVLSASTQLSRTLSERRPRHLPTNTHVPSAARRVRSRKARPLRRALRRRRLPVGRRLLVPGQLAGADPHLIEQRIEDGANANLLAVGMPSPPCVGVVALSLSCEHLISRVRCRPKLPRARDCSAVAAFSRRCLARADRARAPPRRVSAAHSLRSQAPSG